MKLKFSQQREASRDYDVLRQEQRGARWEKVGEVCGFGDGPGGWAALGKDADAWTSYFGTRSAATEEMLAGHTFQTRQLEALRAERAARQLAAEIEEPELEAEL